jgi:hypothetical protein
VLLGPSCYQFERRKRLIRNPILSKRTRFELSARIWLACPLSRSAFRQGAEVDFSARADTPAGRQPSCGGNDHRDTGSAVRKVCVAGASTPFGGHSAKAANH